MKLTAIKSGNPFIMFDVHATGCRDIFRRYNLDQIEARYDLEANTKTEVAHEIYPPDQFEYDEVDLSDNNEDFRFMACCGTVPE